MGSDLSAGQLFTLNVNVIQLTSCCRDNLLSFLSLAPLSEVCLTCTQQRHQPAMFTNENDFTMCIRPILQLTVTKWGNDHTAMAKRQKLVNRDSTEFPGEAGSLTKTYFQIEIFFKN